VAGIAVFLLVVPRRLDATATLLAAAAGSAILISATSQRDALVSGVPTPAAIHQGTQLIWLSIIVCGGVALLQVALGLAAVHLERPRWLAPGRRELTRRAIVALAVVAVLGLAAGVPGKLDHRWQEFKSPVIGLGAARDTTVFSRL